MSDQSGYLDDAIITAITAQVEDHGHFALMDVVDDVMASIAPADYASTLRLIVSQRASVITPIRSTP
ncbi:hypothetical protein CVS54_01380 [Microbacterium oxydans]|uniref:Uncharacterized protein n=1 Tax=Microbacterium oxydans TaxID=82380 RepID=A0A3S9WJ11_9MICO|nr:MULTISPECIES: hypothetical protein [Microbacterium]AZS40058.1 hypothetical protein CVS54_01380 [Microbacterium oxydans]